MATTEDVQQILFDKIKTLLPPHASPVDEIAELLHISTDGVYRRIRGETPLRLNEAAVLCNHFQISLDELTNRLSNDQVIFHPSGQGSSNLDFETYLHSLKDLISQILQRGAQKTLIAAKDIPVFHLFQFPELASFKMFFWQKTIFNDPSLTGKQFELDQPSEKQSRCLSLCHQIAEKYALIPSTEIWNEETAVSFLKQISYYYESGLFKNKADAIRICEQVEAYFSHLKMEAELGYKFIKDHPPTRRNENFSLYLNDLILIDNLIHVDYVDNSQTFLIYHSIEYLSTSNPNFCLQINDWLETLTKKSVLISTVAERQRNMFFMKISERINQLKASIR